MRNDNNASTARITHAEAPVDLLQQGQPRALSHAVIRSTRRTPVRSAQAHAAQSVVLEQHQIKALADALRARQRTTYERVVKPVMDRLIAGLLILVLSPVLLVIWLTVLLALGRPVILGQRRAGLDGTPFTMLKFRTMLPDRRAVAPSDVYAGPERRRTHKSMKDPRHTRLGRMMRKMSLDELPQLFNVLLGRMSLVGPRPEMYHLIHGYSPWQRTRHLVKPGLTGLWQTTERGRGLALHECIDLDLIYIDGLCLRTDLTILGRTPLALLRVRNVI